VLASVSRAENGANFAVELFEESFMLDLDACNVAKGILKCKCGVSLALRCSRLGLDTLDLGAAPHKLSANRPNCPATLQTQSLTGTDGY
jgi:hypothetical protein